MAEAQSLSREVDSDHINISAVFCCHDTSCQQTRAVPQRAHSCDLTVSLLVTSR